MKCLKRLVDIYARRTRRVCDVFEKGGVLVGGGVECVMKGE